MDSFAKCVPEEKLRENHALQRPRAEVVVQQRSDGFQAGKKWTTFHQPLPSLTIIININLVRFFDHLAVVFHLCKMLQKMVDFSQAKSEAEAEKRRLAERKERLLLKADDHGEAGGSV